MMEHIPLGRGDVHPYDGAKRLKGASATSWSTLPVWCCWRASTPPTCTAATGAREIIASASSNDIPRVELVWADQGYTGAFARWLQDARGWRLHVVRHPERQLWRYGLEVNPAHTFRVLPRRRVVERTFTSLGQARRLSRDHERLPAVSEAMISGAMRR